jgi:hypothetical protein
VLPESVAALEAQCAERGIALIDAPVSGGSPACGGGHAHRHVRRPAGWPSTAAQAGVRNLRQAGRAARPGGRRPARQDRQQRHAGRQHGHRHGRDGAAEALGIERAAFAELINASSGRSFGFEVFARLPVARRFRHGRAAAGEGRQPAEARPARDVGAASCDAAAARFLGGGQPNKRLTAARNKEFTPWHFSLDQFRLDGKVAVVTGAGGRGNSIGRAYALGFANAGAAVVVADLNERRAQSSSPTRSTRGRQGIGVQASTFPTRPRRWPWRRRRRRPSAASISWSTMPR